VDGYAPPLMRATTGVIAIADRITSAPGAPNPGDRYIVTASYSTFETHDIIEFTGQTGTYIELTPPTDCGWLAYVQDEDSTYQYQGTAWVELAASQAVMETGTATGRFTAPGNQHYHPGHPKAWGSISYSGSTPSLVANYKTSSITDTATGVVTANWTTQMSATTAYAVVPAIASDLAGVKSGVVTSKSASYGTSGAGIYMFTATDTADTANAATDLFVTYVALGDV
jgi:hypothetical protein